MSDNKWNNVISFFKADIQEGLKSKNILKNDVLELVDTNDLYSSHWKNHELMKNKNKMQRAHHFISWVNSILKKEKIEVNNILDAGCGEGYHLPYYDDKHVKFALDYSTVIHEVDNCTDYNNFYPIRGDILNLPFKNESISVYIAFGSINCTPDIERALDECLRVLEPQGVAFIWAFALDNSFINKMIKFDRVIYSFIPKFLKKLYRLFHIPLYLLLGNSSGMNLKENTLSEFDEIISNNLSPVNLEVFTKSIGWSKYLENLDIEVIAEYKDMPSGIAIKKK